MQEDFAWYSGRVTKGYEDPDAKQAAEFAVPLVMCKFADTIKQAVKAGIATSDISILATAHDFDIIPKFKT